MTSDELIVHRQSFTEALRDVHLPSLPIRHSSLVILHSVDPHGGSGGKPMERAHAAYAIPGIFFAGRFPLALIALEESWNEKLFGQGRELDASRLSIVHHPAGVSEIHYLNDRARLGCVVGDLVIVLGTALAAGSKAHQGVAVCWSHVGAIEKLFVCETVPLRREFGPPGEDPGYSCLAYRCPHFFQAERKRLEQLGCGEHAPDVVAGLKNRNRLIDTMVLVGLQLLGPAFLDQLDHPARVQVDAEADAAAVLGEMLDRQAQA